MRHLAVHALAKSSFLAVRHLNLETLILYIPSDMSADGFHRLVGDQHIALSFEDARPLPEIDWHELDISFLVPNKNLMLLTYIRQRVNRHLRPMIVKGNDGRINIAHSAASFLLCPMM
jgi:hypothetical protein